MLHKIDQTRSEQEQTVSKISKELVYFQTTLCCGFRQTDFLRDDFIDQAVFLGFFGSHEVVAIRIVFNCFEFLTRVLH